MPIRILLIGLLWIAPLVLLGQKGPGGVSVESGSQSTCRVWFDASALTGLADGDELTSWPDVSLSNKNDKAEPKSGYLPPYFRDDAANTINGHPVVTFDDGRFLLMQSTSDLNLTSITHSKTVFFAFRTSTDVTSKQVIFEEGGCWRGFNVYIQNDFIHVGAYDLNHNGVNNNGTTTDSDNTPQFGYTFVKKHVDANSTYVLTVQFYALNNGVVQDNSNYYIKGWLNGQVFETMDKTTSDLTVNGNNGIGTLYKHPNPIGLGAANDDIVDIDGPHCSNTGDFTFQGRLAELCYYNDRLTETQRIIIENYLGAKYFANFIVNDKYEHQANYGNEVIGIGQATNSASNRHDQSQGRNPFLISATNASSNYTQGDEFFLTGHNGANLALTSSGVPNNSPVIQRLQRTWRVDERNNFKSVRFKIDSGDLPAAPTGYSKLVLLVDETSVNFPNFSLASTVVKEVQPTSGTTYQVDYNFTDNSFYTFAWLKPQVEFGVSEFSALEADAPATSSFTVPVTLNYQPVSNTPNKVGYHFVDVGQTAESADYTYTIPSGGLTIPAYQSTANISVNIVNDNLPDDQSTEQFLIIIDPGSPTTTDVGERDTLVFYILDDDPPPTGSFVGSSANVSENGGSIYIKVRRTGDPNDMSSTSSKIRIRRKASPNEGTATYNTDYTLESSDGWRGSAANRVDTVAFAAANVSSQLDSIKIIITDDIINEADETVNFVLEGAENIAIDSSSVTEFTLNIIEDDPLPEANFIVDNQTGYESVGDPVIFVELNRPSSRDVEVHYSIATTEGTASYENDYTGATTGSMLFQPGDTLAYPSPLNIENGDATGEPDETIIFYLDSADNATIGNLDKHTYTIIDYAPFEWKGAAGVGKNSDNIVWVDADRMAPVGIKTNINNFSPRDINIKREDGNNNRATLIANGINSRQSIQFDGVDNQNDADCYRIDDNSFTNLAGFAEKKAYFFVVKPTAIPTATAGNHDVVTASNCRILYEEGGNSRGASIYFYNSHLYFHLWNDVNDDGSGDEAPWGFHNSGNNADKVASTVWARSSQTISANNAYIISCIYDDHSSEPIMVYVNGKKGTMSSNIQNPSDVGRLYSHGGDIGLGGLTNGGRVHFTARSVGERRAPFKGLMSEFIMYHEPNLNEARRTIIENYLSAKYDIALDNFDTRQVFDLAYADLSSNPNNDFNQEVAGVGQIISGSDTLYHGDAQGTSILRVKNPQFTGTPSAAFLQWGHNSEDLTDTWQYSYWNADLPPGVEERSGMVWKMFESPNNTISKADIYINFSASANATSLNDTTYLKLLVNTTNDPQDFSNAAVYHVTEVRSGNIAFFKSVPITNGMYFTLGNSSPITLFPLPVELIDFTAKLEGNYVDINWVTKSEFNNDYFAIERAGSDLNWKEIAQVPGAGNSNSSLYYNDKDREPLPEISYYRLKQVDFDGKFKYSDVVSVVNAQSPNGDEFQLFPNPSTNGSVFVHIPDKMSKSSVGIQIFSATGVRVFGSEFTSGQRMIEIRYGNLPSGIYFVRIGNSNTQNIKKLIVKR